MKQTEILAGDGIYPAVHRSRYDVLDRTNFSRLKWMKKSPKHFKYHLVHPAKDTDPMKVGRVVHVAAFEPTRFLSATAMWDGGTRKGPDWEKFKLENAGKELLTKNENDRCMSIQKAVEADAKARRYVSKGQGEVTMLWTVTVSVLQENGSFKLEEIPCKGRIDFDAKDAIVDLKTARDVSADAFGRQAHDLGYFTQAAWYVDGYAYASGGTMKPYVIVAVENVEPFDLVTYVVTKEDLELGRLEYRSWLDKLAYCRSRNFWPGYSSDDEPLVLQRPPWARPDEGDEDDLSDLTSGGKPLDELEG